MVFEVEGRCFTNSHKGPIVTEGGGRDLQVGACYRGDLYTIVPL